MITLGNYFGSYRLEQYYGWIPHGRSHISLEERACKCNQHVHYTSIDKIVIGSEVNFAQWLNLFSVMQNFKAVIAIYIQP